MVRININRFLYACTLIICNLTHSIIRLIQRHTERLMNSWSKKYRSVKIVHRSENFLIVDKPYDMYINSNNPDRKVKTYLFNMHAKYSHINLGHYVFRILFS